MKLGTILFIGVVAGWGFFIFVLCVLATILVRAF